MKSKLWAVLDSYFAYAGALCGLYGYVEWGKQIKPSLGSKK